MSPKLMHYGIHSEIFGPILPVIEVEDVEEAIQVLSDRCVCSTAYECMMLNCYYRQSLATCHLRVHK